MGKIEIFESRNYQDLPYAWIRHYFTRDWKIYKLLIIFTTYLTIV